MGREKGSTGETRARLVYWSPYPTQFREAKKKKKKNPQCHLMSWQIIEGAGMEAHSYVEEREMGRRG